MEVVYVVDLIEVYSIIIGLIFAGVLLLGVFLYWLWDEHLSYLFYKLKRKIKKV